MARYNLSQLMTRAWTIYRKGQELTFGEALHRSWLAEKAAPVNAQRIEAAKEAAGPGGVQHMVRLEGPGL